MADLKRRLPANVPGDFYVDASCIDCDACRWIAPATFDEVDGQSRVHRQPQGPQESEERRQAELALVSCPTGSIGTTLRHSLKEAVAAFPRPIQALRQELRQEPPDAADDNVFHCGFHDEKSYGAASWFIVRPQGNVLVDVPRFAAPLVKRLEQLGGVALLFLTHEDDVADQARFAAHFGARRVMHRADLDAGTRDVEIVLDGADDVALADDLLVIPTPGHTAGSLCLLHADRFLFTGDHIAWDSAAKELHSFAAFNRAGWDLQRHSVERLAEHRFEWMLPGHGHPVWLPADEMHEHLLACAAAMGRRRIA